MPAVKAYSTIVDRTQAASNANGSTVSLDGMPFQLLIRMQRTTAHQFFILSVKSVSK